MTNAFSRRTFLQGAAFAAAGLLLGSDLAPSALAAADEKFTESYSTNVSSTQTLSTSVTLRYKVGSNVIKAETTYKNTVSGKAIEKFEDKHTYTLTSDVSRVEQLVVHEPYTASSRTDVTYTVFYVPAGTDVTLSEDGMFLLPFPGKTLADVKASVESRYSDNPTYLDSDAADATGPNTYTVEPGSLYGTMIWGNDDFDDVREHVYFCAE